MNTDALVRDALYRFVDDVSHLMRLAALETIETALGTRGARGAKRSPDELTALSKRLRDYIAKHPGRRIEQIAEGMGTSTRELTLPLKKLISEKRIARKGRKRATTYTAK